jgi:hypothetical protein
MSPKPRRRWLLGAVLALAAVTAAVIISLVAAVSMLKGRVERAVGPTSEMAALRVGWSSVVIEGLRMPGPSDWPAKDALRAERVTIVPSLWSLFSGDVYRISSLTLTRPYLSALRSRGGKLVALPGLHGDSAAKGEAASEARTVGISEVVIEDGAIDIFDATVAAPPLKISLEQVAASVREVSIPSLHGRSHFELDGVVKGVREDGRAHLAGWVDLGTRDSSISTRLRSVDLVPLQSYLIRKGEAGILGGRFDLDLQSEVRGEHLQAPGKITLIGLQLEPAESMMGTFMGLPRRALLAGLEEKGGKLSADFTLEGDIDKPEFSLDEALSTRFAYSLAETLGVSLGDLVEGTGRLGLRGGEAAGEAARGVGGALRDLFKDKPKR